MAVARQPGRPTDLTEGVLRERILKEAAKLFAENGYAGTSIQHIVDAAGTTKPMVYYYFKNKEGLYRELVLTSYENIRRQVERIDASTGTTEEKLIAVAKANFDLVKKSPDLAWFGFITYFSRSKDAPEVNIQESGMTNFLIIKRIIEEGIAAGEVRGDGLEVALSFNGLMVIYIMAHIMSPEVSSLKEDSATKLVQLLFDGVRAPK